MIKNILFSFIAVLNLCCFLKPSPPTIPITHENLEIYFKWWNEQANQERSYSEGFLRRIEKYRSRQTGTQKISVRWRFNDSPTYHSPSKGFIILDYGSVTYLNPKTFLTIPHPTPQQLEAVKGGITVYFINKDRPWDEVKLFEVPANQMILYPKKFAQYNPSQNISDSEIANKVADSLENADLGKRRNSIDGVLISDIKNSTKSSPQGPVNLKVPGSNTSIKLVIVPKGSIRIGLSREKVNQIIRMSKNPVYDIEEASNSGKTKIFDSGFLIGKHEITNEQYAVFDKTRNFKNVDKQLPVTNIRFEEANAFCRWLDEVYTEFDVRLPSEAEWEYAAKGNSDNMYTWDNSYRIGKANTESFGVLPVGSNPQSDSWCGASDLIGNVEEICKIDNSSYLRESNIPYVARGGSFSSDQFNCRVTSRHLLYHTDEDHIGFRIVVIPK